MGIYDLFFFISGAFSTAGIGRLLDRQSAGCCLNPVTSSAAAWIYCNIFIMLAVVAAALRSLPQGSSRKHSVFYRVDLFSFMSLSQVYRGKFRKK